MNTDIDQRDENTAVSSYEHVCERLPENGVYVYFAARGVGQRAACWTLRVSRESTEEDIEENHIINEVGESIWTFTAEISFCPYCGYRLEFPNTTWLEENGRIVKEHDSESKYGEFSLFDQENWSGRLR